MSIEVLATAHDWSEHVDDCFASFVKSGGIVESEIHRKKLLRRIVYFRGMAKCQPECLAAIEEYENLTEFYDYVQGAELGKPILEQSAPQGWESVGGMSAEDLAFVQSVW